MTEDRPDLDLGRFRSYLVILAQQQLSADRLRGRVAPSDLAQQTILEAHQHRDQFRGSTEAELAAWLRKILANNLVDAIRHHQRERRDVQRERSLEASLDASSARLSCCLADQGLSPGKQAARHEEVLILADALTRLPPDQREAIVLHHLRGQTLAATSAEMERSEASVAGLLHRGLDQLRQLMRERRETGHVS